MHDVQIVHVLFFQRELSQGSSVRQADYPTAHNQTGPGGGAYYGQEVPMMDQHGKYIVIYTYNICTQIYSWTTVTLREWMMGDGSKIYFHPSPHKLHN